MEMQVRMSREMGTERVGREFFFFLEDFTLRILKAYRWLYHGFSNTPGSE